MIDKTMGIYEALSAGIAFGLVMIVVIYGSMSFATRRSRDSCMTRIFVGVGGVIASLMFPFLAAVGVFSNEHIAMPTPQSYVFCITAYITLSIYIATIIIDSHKSRYWCPVCGRFRIDHYKKVNKRGGRLSCGHYGDVFLKEESEKDIH